jgi:hypothetical protein
MLRRALSTVVGLVLLVPLPVFAQEEKKPEAENAADIPIRRVVMFNSGVAYFEHQGEVEGDAEIDLKFNVRDVNDLLKSMVLEDQGGGTISRSTRPTRSRA